MCSSYCNSVLYCKENGNTMPFSLLWTGGRRKARGDLKDRRRSERPRGRKDRETGRTGEREARGGRKELLKKGSEWETQGRRTET